MKIYLCPESSAFSTTREIQRPCLREARELSCGTQTSIVNRFLFEKQGMAVIGREVHPAVLTCWWTPVGLLCLLTTLTLFPEHYVAIEICSWSAFSRNSSLLFTAFSAYQIPIHSLELHANVPYL